MAANGESGFDLKTHEGTYAGFTSLFKWGTIVSFVIAAIVVLLIAS